MQSVLLLSLSLLNSGLALRVGKQRRQPWEAFEVPLTRTPGGWYVAEIDVAGAPKHLVVDTGSPWLWAFGSEGDGDGDAPHFHAQYTGVQLDGVVLQESLGLTGSAGGNATVQQCSVGRATGGDDFWQHQAGVEGVAGLACGTQDAGSSSTFDGLNVSTSCLSQVAAGNNLFSVELTHDGGTLSFGAIPERLLVGLRDMPHSLFCGNWRAPLRAMFGEAASAKALGESAEGILDTGEPGIRGPLQTIMELAASLGAKSRVDPESGSVHFEVPCDTQLASFTLALGGDGATRVAIQGAELIRKSRDGACSIMLRGSDSKQWVLGMPFFRSIRGAVFSSDEQKVYIAP